MRNVLVPISLNNDKFSTDNVAQLIEDLLSSGAHVEILIADRLQIYNRVVKALANRAGSVDIGRIEIGVNETSEQRHRWSSRLLDKISVSERRVSIVDVNKYADAIFIDIFRRVLILFDIDSNFRESVETYAHEYVVGRFSERGRLLREVAQKMSIRYVLEEASISLRVRCYNNLREEYYFGEAVEPIVNLYRNRYKFNIQELSGQFSIDGDAFQFINVERSSHPSS